MSKRRAETDATWDFSFVGETRNLQRVDAEESPEVIESDDRWDFSFVGARDARQNAMPDSADAVPSWDFSFTGTDQSSDRAVPDASNDGRLVAPEPAWDFSFADLGAAGESPPAPENADGPPLGGQVSSTEAETIDRAAVDRAAVVAEPTAEVPVVVAEPAEWPPPAASPSGELARVDLDETDVTDELTRDDGLLVEPPATERIASADEVITTEPDVIEVAAPPAASGPIKVLTVCTHNRTRSVMSMALLQAGFDRALGEGVVIVRSLGFGPEGEPAIPDAIEQMAERQLDVSRHGSLQVTAERVGPADLILTAEKDHVVKIAEAAPEVFRRTFTLPEFCRLAAADPVPGQRSLRQWFESMSSSRTPAAYLGAEVPEVEDPTGSPKRQFAAATEAIEAMCDTVVELVSSAV